MKVRPFKIPKPVHQSLLVQVDRLPAFYDKLHQHEEIQISCILKGTGKLLVADSIHPYSPGDIVVIGKNCPHVFQSNPSTIDSHMVSLFFSKDSFGEHFFDLLE
jgi:quercetin dioxygenase-like cupin family protein